MRDRESVSLPRGLPLRCLISTILLGRGATTARESRKFENAVRLRVSRKGGQKSSDGTVGRPERSFSLLFFLFFFLPAEMGPRAQNDAPDTAQNSTITAEQAANP